MNVMFAILFVAKGKKSRKIFQISFSNILRNEYNHTKVLPKRFYLNGNIIEFRPQI